MHKHRSIHPSVHSQHSSYHFSIPSSLSLSLSPWLPPMVRLSFSKRCFPIMDSLVSFVLYYPSSPLLAFLHLLGARVRAFIPLLLLLSSSFAIHPFLCVLR
ncbi:hypothetical protein IWX49DRAFT_586069 [Phyllosticta citricarpa]